jgi:hypothetical protein
MGTLLMQVYGITAKADPPQYRHTLNDARVTLRAGPDTSARVSATLATCNLPEVPAP